MAGVEEPCRIESEHPSVAVLIGPKTASSGEALAVAFRGRANTRFFGQPTRGLSSSNRTFFLSDKAILNLTSALFADRTGRTYAAGLTPDEPTDTALVAASGWLLGHPACQR